MHSFPLWHSWKSYSNPVFVLEGKKPLYSQYRLAKLPVTQETIPIWVVSCIILCKRGTLPHSDAPTASAQRLLGVQFFKQNLRVLGLLNAYRIRIE